MKVLSLLECLFIITHLCPAPFSLQVEIHEDFIQSCFDRLKASYDTLCVLDGDKDSINCARQEAIRMVRVLTVLKEYINECDSDYHEERTILPMSRYGHQEAGGGRKKL